MQYERNQTSPIKAAAPKKVPGEFDIRVISGVSDPNFDQAGKTINVVDAAGMSGSRLTRYSLVEVLNHPEDRFASVQMVPEAADPNLISVLEINEKDGVISHTEEVPVQIVENSTNLRLVSPLSIGEVAAPNQIQIISKRKFIVHVITKASRVQLGLAEPDNQNSGNSNALIDREIDLAA